MVRLQSFSGRRDENPYTHLREFEQNCSIISIPGMHHKTIKWKLFPFTLTGLAKDWYSITVGSVEGDWNALKEKFCLRYYHSSKIIKLRIEALSFKQQEEESLGVAWACYTELISSGPDLGITEAMHLQHFACGLSTNSITFLDKASGGSFLHKSISEVKAILDGILKNTEYMKTRLKNLESLLKEQNLLFNLQHQAHKRLSNQTLELQILNPSAKIIDLSSFPCLTMMNQQWMLMSHYYQKKKVMLMENLR